MPNFLKITKPIAPVPATGFEAKGNINPTVGTWISGTILNGATVTPGRVVTSNDPWSVMFPPLPGGILTAGSNQTLRVECLNVDVEDSVPLDVVGTIVTYRDEEIKARSGDINFFYPTADGETYRAPLVWAAGYCDPPIEEVYAILFNPADPVIPQLGQMFQLGGLWVAIFANVTRGDGQFLRVRFKNPTLSAKATRIINVRY